MAGSGVTLYATTSGGNKVVLGSIDWRENTYMPSQINDNVSQIMADIRAMANSIAGGYIEIGDGDGVYTAAYHSANQFRFDGADVSAYYRAGMRVRAVAPTPGTISGTISTVAYSAPNTLVTVAWDSGALSNEAITAILVGIGSGGGAGGQPSYRNILGRNGGFEVWQRGAGGSAVFAIPPATQQYIADGWFFANNPNQASTIVQGAPVTTGSRYSAYIGRNSGQTGVVIMGLEYPLDAEEIAAIRGQIVTLSFSAEGSANWSPAGGTLSAYLITGTGPVARILTTAYTGSVTVIAITAALAINNPLRFTGTSSVVVPTNATQATVVFQWTPVGTAGANDSFAIDDVQLEVGSVATPFERRPFESELLACRRHFQKSFNYTVAPQQNAGDTGMLCITQAVSAGSGMYTNTVPTVPELRVAPTYTLFNPHATNAQARNANTGTDCTVTAPFVTGTNGFNLSLATPAGSAPGNLLGVHWTADAGI